jgi:Ca2+/H+ antiporter, TMEM165/GDT1 family
MKFRRRPSPLLLLLIPSITSALAVDNQGKAVSQNRDAKVEEVPLPLTTIPPSPKKEDLGTPDAPVDGLDGKPHKGPFLEYKLPTKATLEVEDLVTEEPTQATVGPQKLVEEDGVMNDKNRPTPKKGTTGTEGGVSEKDRARKEKQDSGKKLKNIPDPPKEAPPLPHSEQEHLNNHEKQMLGEKPTETVSTTSKALGAIGLEVGRMLTYVDQK